MEFQEFSNLMREQHPTLFRPDDQLDVAARVGNGWLSLLAELFDALSEHRLKGVFWIVQVKEKFGMLRVQVAFEKDDRELRHDVYKLLAHFEARSSTTCERCGSEQGVLRVQPWERVRCPRCSLFESLEGQG
ncbi:hypothetical protein [Achromobacter mucicolens]|uniref:hypothetical protein n=1 Tax=Achromobacter mucicolens TaxID=1389922 RepID=UPI00158387C5|nr:hypothetical protein [Achromobacter mucicolens]